MEAFTEEHSLTHFSDVTSAHFPKILQGKWNWPWILNWLVTLACAVQLEILLPKELSIHQLAVETGGLLCSRQARHLQSLLLTAPRLLVNKGCNLCLKIRAAGSSNFQPRVFWVPYGIPPPAPAGG